MVSDAGGQSQFYTVLLGTFGVVAFVLAVVGVYGVIAYSAGQRTHEMGIRMALGAQRGDVLRLVVGQAAVLAAIGITAGLCGARLLTRFLEGMLFDVSPTDPLIFALVSAALVCAALAASYIPARRASKIDPMAALRWE
jgi:ABC-type antimicrobial peptide transport system permease subunit